MSKGHWLQKSDGSLRRGGSFNAEILTKDDGREDHRKRDVGVGGLRVVYQGLKGRSQGGVQVKAPKTRTSNGSTCWDSTTNVCLIRSRRKAEAYEVSLDLFVGKRLTEKKLLRPARVSQVARPLLNVYLVAVEATPQLEEHQLNDCRPPD